MKKFLSFIILAVVMTVTAVGVLPASADGEPIFEGSKDFIEQAIREYCGIPAQNKIFVGSLPPNHSDTLVAFFVEVVGFHQMEQVTDITDSSWKFWQAYSAAYSYQECVGRFVDDNGYQEYLTVINHTLSVRSNGGYSDSTTTYSQCPSVPFINGEGQAKYNCLPADEFDRVFYNLLNPPDVFTYSISPNNFTLKNGGIGAVNVDIQFTPAYLQWLERAHDKGVNVDGRYNVCVWVSDVCPSASESASLLNSMNSSRYTKLNYGQYLYDGGPYRDQLQQTQPENSPTSLSAVFPLKILAEGVCVSSLIDPSAESNRIQILTENIKGFDEHKPLYVCVLGAYSGMQGGNCTAPDMYNAYYVSQLTATASVNDTYATYLDNGNSYTMHTYWFPFSSASSAVGDGYQGNCTYKPQTVNGKTYEMGQPVTDLTNKSALVPPDTVHDVEMPEDQWIKPEDYKQWQIQHENEKRYGEQFDFNTQSLKDVLDKEGDFFSFLKSAFNIFPSYFMQIFVAFLVGMLVVCLLKFIL